MPHRVEALVSRLGFQLRRGLEPLAAAQTASGGAIADVSADGADPIRPLPQLVHVLAVPV